MEIVDAKRKADSTAEEERAAKRQRLEELENERERERDEKEAAQRQLQAVVLPQADTQVQLGAGGAGGCWCALFPLGGASSRCFWMPRAGCCPHRCGDHRRPAARLVQTLDPAAVRANACA